MKKQRILESDIQMAFFKWALMNRRFKKELSLMFAINNGLKLSIGQAVKAKKMGTNKGIPDIFLPVARNKNHGLFIELKRGGGILSPFQKEKIALLSQEGYAVKVCHSLDEAINAVINYLETNSTEEFEDKISNFI